MAHRIQDPEEPDGTPVEQGTTAALPREQLGGRTRTQTQTRIRGREIKERFYIARAPEGGRARRDAARLRYLYRSQTDGLLTRVTDGGGCRELERVGCKVNLIWTVLNRRLESGGEGTSCLGGVRACGGGGGGRKTGNAECGTGNGVIRLAGWGNAVCGYGEGNEPCPKGECGKGKGADGNGARGNGSAAARGAWWERAGVRCARTGTGTGLGLREGGGLKERMGRVRLCLEREDER